MTVTEPMENTQLRRPSRTRGPGLSAREVEVLLAWIKADSKSAVSQTLYIAPGTVNTHLSRIRSKYHLAGRTAPTKAALLARAVQDGLIGLEEL